MDSKSRGLIKSLENWAKKVTTGYKDVNVRDMSSSFRNGLAFCAIIHHYRPDLINFESLSKENILQNNSLAFRVAEKDLGVPALLDAEDMVEYAHPDRLSIITYLSQLYNCFENQNKVNSIKSNLKRINQNDSIGPPVKLTVVQPSILSIKRHEVCLVCKHRVFILERLIVDGKLYHTACFKCHKCNCLLNPGAYVESDTPGFYECSVCPDETVESGDTLESSLNETKTDESSYKASPITSLKLQKEKDSENQSPLTDSVSRARNSFLQNSLSLQTKSNEQKSSSLVLENAASRDMVDSENSVKAKISVFETNQASKSNIHQPKSTNDLKLAKSISSKVSHEESSLTDKTPIARERLSLLPSSSFLKDVSKSCKSEDKDSVSEKEAETKNGTGSLNIPLSRPYSNSLLSSKFTEADITSCDNLTRLSKSIENTSSSSVTALSQVKLGEPDPSRGQSSRPLSLTNDYKSPLKSPRDIFQTNIQPLKLTIPSIAKREPSSLPATPLNHSADSNNVQIPAIRSTYSTFPRPGDYGNSEPKVLPTKSSVSSSESNLSDVIHSRWSGTSPRRSSFESNSKNLDSEIISASSVKQKSFLRVQSSNELETPRAVSAMSLSKKDTDSDKTLCEKDSNLSDKKSSNSFASFTPIPTARRSLEKRFPAMPLKNVSTENYSGGLPRIEKSSDIDKGLEIVIKNSSSPAKIEVPKIQTINVDDQAADEEYPDDLNPFGDDVGDNESEEYPDDLNPFGDDEESTAHGAASDVAYDESKNPFASDDDDDQQDHTPAKPYFSTRSSISQDSSPMQSNSFSSISSPTGSLRGTARKRRAPRPPKLSDIFPNDSIDSDADASINSLKSSPSMSKKSLQTPSPKVRKSKPAPPPPPPSAPISKQNSQTDLAANAKHAKDMDNLKLKSSAKISEEVEASKQTKKKKRPAPSVPIPARKDMKKIPFKEIMKEMKEIEERQREYERQGREIELLIRDKDKDEEPSVEEEEYIMQLFELVNQKNALFRRQAELMYIKRSQRLEEQQYEIDKQLRILMEKPDSEKTDADRAKEEELTMELIDIVDQRNSIIDSIEMDRRREIEEDVSVQVQLEMKNGDLPITAEIKEKSGKSKKSKNKKDKKKHQENGSSNPGKGTLKKKNFIKKLTLS